MHLFLAGILRVGGDLGLVIKPAERLGSRSLYSLAFGKTGVAFWRIDPDLDSKAWTLLLASVNSQAFEFF